MFGNIKMVLIALAALAIVTTIGIGANHYFSVLAEREAALAERDLLTIENAGLVASRDAFEKQAEALSAAMNEMVDVATEAESEVERLNALFRKHDMAKLTKGRAGMLTTRINRGTATVLGMFDAATAPGYDSGGSPAPDNPAAPSAD